MESYFAYGLLYTICLLVIPAHLASCPDSVYPCECHNVYSSTGHYNGWGFGCTGLWSGEELKDLIHNSDFGNNDERKYFQMYGSPLVKVLENGTFWPLNFEKIELNNDTESPNAMEEIETGAFFGSERDLYRIDASYMNLKLFPFEDLYYFNHLSSLFLQSNNITFVRDLMSTSLRYLYLQMNSITEIPGISMKSLTHFNISMNSLTSLPDHVFWNVAELENLDMSHNPLVSLPPLAFHDLSSIRYMNFSNGLLSEVQPDMWNNTSNMYLREVRLNNNSISVLPTGFFTPGSENDILLDLSNNVIESVQPGAFRAIRSMHIYLENNRLSVLEEESWRYLLQNRVLLHLEGNPFACGCDIAWIVRDHYLFDSVADEPTCITGEKLVDLDANDFTEC
ncbi:unnamed protein product [Meganyctiphanes norvegica]|uniref:Uncharacterized protein n=1 Tax=Meganyctiphanes norvegica TaxID=48144 RepID=A0AAV2RE95_MEGNR